MEAFQPSITPFGPVYWHYGHCGTHTTCRQWDPHWDLVSWEASHSSKGVLGFILIPIVVLVANCLGQPWFPLAWLFLPILKSIFPLLLCPSIFPLPYSICLCPPISAWFFLSLLSQTHLPTLPSTFPSTSCLTCHHSNCGPFLSNFCGLAPTLPSSSSSHQWCWSTARTREQLMMLSSVGAPSPNWWVALFQKYCRASGSATLLCSGGWNARYLQVGHRKIRVQIASIWLQVFKIIFKLQCIH